MAKMKVSCPECDAQLALDPTIEAGKKIRCPKCETVFAIPEPTAPDAAGARDTRPESPVRRKKQFRKKKQGMPVGVLVAMIGGGVLLLGGAALGGYYLMKGKSAHKDVVPVAGIGTKVGQLAQKIEAEDIDGVPFKLSDYRGKVVLLDFWGHW